MIKTLTQYPGVVQHLLDRAAHRPPPAPGKPSHRPVTTPGSRFPTTHRDHIRRQLRQSTGPTAARIHFAPALHYARMQWFHPTPEEERRSQLRALIIRTAIPLVFIFGTAFLLVCLTAFTDTSFTP